MAINQIGFPTARQTDKAIFDAAQAVCKEGGYKMVEVELHYVFGPSVTLSRDKPTMEVQAVLDQDTYAFRNLKFKLNNGFQIGVNRPTAEQQQQQSPQLHDNVFVIPQEDAKPPEFTKLIGLCRRHFGSIDSKPLMDFLGEEHKRHYLERERAVDRLEQMQAEFFKKFQDFTLEQEKRNQLRQDEQEQKYTARLDELNRSHQERMSEVAKEKVVVEKIRREIDDRESRHARRHLQTEMQKRLTDLDAKFELTSGTRRRRWPVLSLFIVLLLFFGGLATNFILVEFSDDPQITWQLVARQITFSLAFGVVAWSFIRWANSWFRDHADQEFRFKRHGMDVLRASWVVEMALEWKEAKGAEIPQFLAERLSRNLFADEKQAEAAITPAEVMAAFFGASTNAEGQFGDFRLAFNRKGLNKELDAKP